VVDDRRHGAGASQELSAVRPDPHPRPGQVLVVDVGSSMTKLALVTGDGLVRSYQRLAGPCPVVATGGLGPTVARHSDTITAVEPDLTLWGTHLATTTTTLCPPGVPVTTGPT
jgi:pantothenate kinase type III